jgi:hypothetical protein
VVFKTAESLEKLSDSKFLQKKINTHAKKSVGFLANPFLAGEDALMPRDSEEDEDLDDEQKEAKRELMEKKRKLEEQGFTLVTEDDTNPHRRRGRDSFGTVVHGIT